MKLHRIHLASATALGVLASVAFANQAQAGAFSFSYTQLDTFEVQGVTSLGGTLTGELTNNNAATGGVPAGTITVLNANDSFSSTANVTGLGASISTASGVPACVGTCPANAFAFQPAPPVTSVFSQAEALLKPTTGAPTTFPSPVISFTQPPDPRTASVGGGASGGTVAQTQLVGALNGAANSSIGLNSGFSFTLSGTTTI